VPDGILWTAPTTSKRINAAPLDELGRFLLANCVETYLQLTCRDAEEMEALQAKGGTEEVRVMRRKLTWAEQIFEEGEEKGVEKGLKKGLEQGARQLLLRMLGLRFGPLSEDVKRRVDEIHSVERLNQMADQILVARSLEEMGLK